MATAPQRSSSDVAAPPRGARSARSRRAALLLALLLPACGPQEEAPRAAPAGWQEFSGSWTAAGRRTEMQLGPQRKVSVVDVSGSLLLSGPTRPAVGFHGQALTFADSLTGMLGRAVWTDEHGDQVFSELDGSRDGETVRIVGRFVGGTGRYAGATGEYAFEWQYLLETEDGRVAGRAANLAGRVRVDAETQPPR